jgi:hypothetical protein
MALDILKIAARIAAPVETMTVEVECSMCDGSGEDVEYKVECEVSPQDLEIRQVTRIDTNQEVDPEAFQIVFGKTALMTLWEEAKQRAMDITQARREESMESKGGGGVGGGGAPPKPKGPPASQTQDE